MEEDAEALPQTLTCYFERDSELRLHYANFQRRFQRAKALGAQWDSARFKAAMDEIIDFVTTDPTHSVGRALLFGVVIGGDLMMIISDTLAPLLGMTKHALNTHFFRMDEVANGCKVMRPESHFPKRIEAPNSRESVQNDRHSHDSIF
jgi:hypothetical protein